MADYWNPWNGAVDAAGQRLDALDPDALRGAVTKIEAAIESHVSAVDDGTLLDGAMVAADDLYKSACTMDRWDESLSSYLAASAGTFFRLLGERGFVLQYLVDNQWADLSRPTQLFPHWYRAAGLTYVCPQTIMLELPEYEVVAKTDGAERAAAFVINEARDIADTIVRGCQERNGHFVHLDCDWVAESFDSADRERGASGVLTVRRDLAPERDSKIQVWYPNGLAPADRAGAKGSPRPQSTEIDLGNWDYPRLTDYWDFGARAIDRHARDLEKLNEAELRAVLSLVADAITDHVDNLPEELLPAAAVAIVDDLYKSACVINRWDDILGTYLATSARTLLSELASRGIHIQYLVDNVWDELERPVDLFPHWFEAAGFVYVCPQEIVSKLAEEDGRSDDVDAEELLSAYIEESRHVGGQIVARCQEEPRHFVQLDCDWVQGSFDQAFTQAGGEGVVTILRIAAADAGTHVKVWWPAGSAQEQGRDTLVEQMDVSNWTIASVPRGRPDP
ncbi:MAG: hypothetical protein WKF96_11780 [Solirubrobacteraceae bacterium]